jgi:hypothetical protein
MRAKIWICNVLVLGGLIACSSEEGQTPRTGFEAFVQEFADKYCAALTGCCAATLDVSSCKASTAAVWKYRGRPIGDGEADFDAAVAGDCIAAIDAHFSSCAPAEDAPPICARVVTGKRALDEACTLTEQCAQPETGTAVCANGVCAPKTAPKLGAACGGAYDCDASDLYCDMSSKTCATRPGLDEACSLDVPCPPEAYCDGASGSVCKPRVQLGAACDSSQCVAGAYCNSGACAEQKGAGEACSGNLLSDECASACDPDTKTCEPPALCAF